MADPIPTGQTGGQPQPQAQSTVVIQQPMTQWAALKQAGWWTQFDWIMLSLIGFVWLTALYWFIFGHPGATGLITIILINISLKLVWGIALVFRCSWFVLRLNADVATLPQESARIAVAYLSGTAPPVKK